MSSLEKAFSLIIAAHAVSVVFHDLKTGERVAVRADESLHAASTMKLAVLLAALKHGGLDQAVVVENRFQSLKDQSDFACDARDDNDDWTYQQIGKPVPLRTLLERMIVRSSNLATNNVMRVVPAAEVMRLGVPGLKVLRGVEDQKAHDAGLDNTATAAALEQLLMQMPPEGLEILQRQELNEGIPAALPPGTRVAHKTGSITRHYHDAALIDGHIILVVMTRDFAAEADAVKVVQDIARAAFQHVLDPLR